MYSETLTINGDLVRSLPECENWDDLINVQKVEPVRNMILRSDS